MVKKINKLIKFIKISDLREVMKKHVKPNLLLLMSIISSPFCLCCQGANRSVLAV